jgi:hypothetical protein
MVLSEPAVAPVVEPTPTLVVSPTVAPALAPELEDFTWRVLGESGMTEVRATVRQIISRVFTYTVNKISPTNIPYYNGLSVHKVSLLRNITIQTDSFGFQAEIIVRLLRAAATYKVVGTTISERKTGSSKAFTIKNILEVAKILGVLKSN